MGLAPHSDGVLGDVPGVTYLYVNESFVLFPFGTGLSYTTFDFEWLDGIAPLTLDAAALVASPPSFGVNVTNVGAVASDVSAVAFFSSGAAGEPISECFDFARASGVAPGASVTLTFTLPPLVAARVSTAGVQAVAPGRYAVSVRGGAADITRELEVTGGESVALFDYSTGR